MRSLLATLLAVAMLASTVAHAATGMTSPMYVYRGAGSSGIAALPAWETFISKNQPAPIKADGVDDFVPFDGWSDFDATSGWSMACWHKAGYKLALAVPLTVDGTTLAQVAAGAEDAHFILVGKNLAANGFNTSTTFIRLGWEFNGGWYPWHAYGNKVAWLAAWQHVVPLIRQGAPNVKIVWNIAEFNQQTPGSLTAAVDGPGAYYPGDTFVDVIGTDLYDNSYMPGTIVTANVPDAPAQPATATTPAKADVPAHIAYTNVAIQPKLWSSVYGDSWGLKDVLAFAAAHGKPYAFPELGVGSRGDGHGGGDDPTFINNAAPYVKGAAFSGYWDWPGADFNGRLHATDFPNSSAAFLANFYPAPPPPAPVVAGPVVDSTFPVKFSDSAFEFGVMDNPDGTKTVTFWRSTALTKTDNITVYLPSTVKSYKTAAGHTYVTSNGSFGWGYPAGTSDVVVTIPAS